MTLKETVELICVLSGYDKNVSFESWYTDDVTCKGYDIYAEDREDNCIEVTAAMGSMDLLESLLDEIKQSPHHHAPFWVQHVPLKLVLNENYRNLQYEREKLRLEHIDKSIKLEKDIFDWIKKNNPCPNCSINDKKHWDDIHYNCEQCHTMSCPIMLEFNKQRDELLQKLYQTPEYIKINNEYQQKDNEIAKQLHDISNQVMKKK